MIGGKGMQKKAAHVALLLCAAMLSNRASAQQTIAAPPPATQSAPANPSPQQSIPEQPSPQQAAQQQPNNAQRTECPNGPCDFQPQHISIATPAPAPAPWPWQQRIAWGADIVLVVLGYVAILLALALLRKIERQTRYGEEAAQAAAESAQAALAHAQAMTRAERPWILMSVRPSQNIVNGFAVMATNRGRGPARVLSTMEATVIAIDEAHLPAIPAYKSQPAAPADPIILLPGESTEIAVFSRADVQRVSAGKEQLDRIEKWEEKIFLYGNVVYRDLAAPDDAAAHESSWFCWYIHGRQKSGMVMAGPPAYNRHS